MALATSLTRDVTSSVRHQVSPGEWQARVDLAAAHRYADVMGWTHLIYNHFTIRVPGEANHFLIKRHDHTFDEVTASSLIKLNLEGKPVGLEQNVNAAGFTIHSAVLGARPDVNAVCHVHTMAGCAVAALKDGLRFYTQESAMFYNRVGYHDFEGVAEEPGERERLGHDLGPYRAMILRNHGLLTCGPSMQDAVLRLNELISACEVQMQLITAGAETREIPHDVAEKAARQFERFNAGHAYGPEWGAILRLLDRKDPSYRD